MNELALFAGAGGGILGGILCGFKTICYVEWEEYCIEIIKARIKDKIYEDAPIWNDVQTFDGKPWAGSVDIITGGFPCQPFSTAGKRLGEDDSRNMWPSTYRIINEVKPEWCLLENVAAILGSYFGQIITDISQIGYDVWWGCLSASTIGAQHQRERLWIVAHTHSNRHIHMPKKCKSNEKIYKKWPTNTPLQITPNEFYKTTADSKVLRNINGVACGPNRIKAIGNGQVSAVVKTIWEIIGNGGK